MYSFIGNNNITSLYIPANITKIQIGFNTINDQYHNLDITVSEQNKIFKSVNKCLINIANKELVHMHKNGKIPEDGSVTKILAYAIEKIDNLYINKYITSISPLGILPKNISCSAENTVFKADGNCLIEKATNTVIKVGQNPTIPNYVKTIGTYAAYFYQKQSSQNVIIIPSTCSNIKNYAFYYLNLDGNKNNIIIYLPSTVTIEKNAFRRISATIYTDVTSVNNIPSGWNSEMLGAGANIEWQYGYSLSQFKSAVGV